jgi:hypothetical protein
MINVKLIGRKSIVVHCFIYHVDLSFGINNKTIFPKERDPSSKRIHQLTDDDPNLNSAIVVPKIYAHKKTVFQNNQRICECGACL